MKTNFADELEYRGYTIQIAFDDDPMNPRTEWDNAAHMVCWHNRYTLGDDRERNREFPTPDSFHEWLKENRADVPVILPLYLYEHSGITISTSSFHDLFDSGQVGYIYLTREDIKREWKWDRITPKRRSLLLKRLEADVEIYDAYLTGQVYGYIVSWKRDDDEELEELDSCWGYYGDMSYAISEAKGIVDWYLDKGPKIHFTDGETLLCGRAFSDISNEEVELADITSFLFSDDIKHNTCRECLAAWNDAPVEPMMDDEEGEE